MKKKFNAIISGVLAVALALTGVSYVSLNNAEADTVAPIKTIAFDSEADIMAANDSAAKIVDDATRGKVISLGAGDAEKDMVGAQISNPWADATVNPDAKEYTKDDIKRAFNSALAIPYGEKFFFEANEPKEYPVKGETEGGGVTWKNLTVSTATKNNGALAEGYDTSLNDPSTGEYRGAEHAQKWMGDTLAATRIKRAGSEVKCADGELAAVSAYKAEKEADYVRPVWDKDDGLTMQFWVNVPEGTTKDTILFSFFNERIVGAFDETAATTFNNTTGHLWVKADGSIEFAELSQWAGDPAATTGGNQISRYAATRNKYQTPAIGNGVNAVSKAGQWVCVTLVCENDYISVYFDGIQVQYTESNISTGDTDGDKFTQDWENPENSPSWTRTEVSTPVKTFNGWFASRNTPTYVLVNSGIYSSFPSWKSKSAHKMQPCPIDGCEGGSILSSQPRITMCQWLQDSATTLWLGGTAGKDLSTWRANEAGTEDYAYVRQYTLAEGTLFDGFEFYDEALTSTEVATAYVNAGGILAATPEPADPTETPAPATDTPVPATETPVPATETPVPSETATPVTGYATLNGEVMKSVVVHDETNYAKYSIDASLAVGDLVFGDRDVTFVEVPESLIGSEYLVTSCDNKKVTTDVVTVTAAKDMVLSVGFDKRLAVAPEWASAFVKTELTCLNNKDVVFEIYQRNLKAGESITLGTQGQVQSVVGYIVIATPGEGTIVNPTETPVPATETPVPATETPVPATETPVPTTETPVPATETPVPATETPVPATATPEAPTDTPVPEILIGDVDKDGDIDATDALLVLKHAAKLEMLEDTVPAMTNDDDFVDALDALNILKVAARLIEKLPVVNE